MAPRKRKIAVSTASQSPEKVKYCTAVIQTMLNAQQQETTHTKLISKLKKLYTTVPHDSFMKSFIQVVKLQLTQDEANEYANNVLKFCAKFVAEPEYSEQSVTHPVMESLFSWLLSTISSVSLIRLRICQLVNLIVNALGSDATLDDTICDKIQRYMLERIRDVSQHVRVQAVLALQRLQDPDNPEDCVSLAFTYHLDKDPSPKVRQTVISALGRNYRTIPYILERLWDTDHRVRRHTYMQMSCYPVRQYKVAQRLKFLEQGLVDHSESVRKVVRNVLLPQWIESYERDYVALVGALKLDADEKEIDRFRKTSKLALFEIFRKNGVKEMSDQLNFNGENKSVPIAELTIERVICWQAMLEYLQQSNSDEQQNYMMELSMFCAYLKELIENPGAAEFMKSPSNASSVSDQTSSTQSDMVDKLQQLYFQYILQILLEIVGMYDLTDEFGCDSLKLILSGILCNETIHETNVKLIMQMFEKLITDVETRLKFFVDLVNSVQEPSRVDFSHSSRMLVETYLEQNPGLKDFKLKISFLRLKILDLKEEESLLAQQKDYAGAQSASEKLNTCNEEYANLVKPLLDEMTASISNTTGDSRSAEVFRDSMLKPRRMTHETINKCLQICFYLVNSPTVRELTPALCELNKTFISRHVQSAQLNTRNWALRVSTAFSMLYDGLSKDTFQLLYQPFLDTASTRLWKTAIECLFELLDRYGFDHFDIEKDESFNDTLRRNKSSRQLFNRNSQDESTSSVCNGNEFYKMAIHFMNTCEDDVISLAIIDGFCRLILHGHCSSSDIVSKLLLRFFNPTTDSETQQILGIFFEALIKKKRQEVLQKALLGTLFTVLEAPNDSPLAEVHPETVVKFIINSTQPVFCSPGVNPHNTIAVTFLRVMHDNLTMKELLKILSRQLLVLEINDDPVLRSDLANSAHTIIQEASLEPNVIKALATFREMMLGTIREPLSFSSSHVPVVASTMNEESDDDEQVDDIDEALSPNEKELYDGDEEDWGEEQEEEEQINRAEERSKINKSILAENSNSSPGSTTTPCAMTTTPPNPSGGSAIKSLRRSLCFSSCTSGARFKVPDESTMRMIRQTTLVREKQTPRSRPTALLATESQKVAEETHLPGAFEIPATQDENGLNTSANTDSDLDIPETQCTPQPSNRRRNSRLTASRVSKAKGRLNRSDSSSSSTSSSMSEGDVVDASPNVAASRGVRSGRLLNKVAAEPVNERKLKVAPRTLQRRSHHVVSSDAISGNRNSLPELRSRSMANTTKTTTQKKLASPDNDSEQHSSNGRLSRSKKVISSKEKTKSYDQNTRKTKKPTNVTSREQNHITSKPCSVLATSTPDLLKTSTKTSARIAAIMSQADTLSSGSRGTGISPSRFKNPTVVISPLNINGRLKQAGLKITSNTAPKMDTSIRRSTRKTTQK